MVLLPLTLNHFWVWIYYSSFSVKHRFFKLSFVDFTVFPFESTRAIDFISLEIAFQYTVLCFDCALSLSFSILKFTIVLYSAFGFDSPRLIVHQALVKLTLIFTTTVIPCVSSFTLLEAWFEDAIIICTLFRAPLFGISLRNAVLPQSINRVNIFMRKHSFAVHRWVTHWSSVVSSVWKDN